MATSQEWTRVLLTTSSKHRVWDSSQRLNFHSSSPLCQTPAFASSRESWQELAVFPSVAARRASVWSAAHLANPLQPGFHVQNVIPPPPPHLWAQSQRLRGRWLNRTHISSSPSAAYTLVSPSLTENSILVGFLHIICFMCVKGINHFLNLFPRISRKYRSNALTPRIISDMVIINVKHVSSCWFIPEGYSRVKHETKHPVGITLT